MDRFGGSAGKISSMMKLLCQISGTPRQVVLNSKLKRHYYDREKTRAARNVVKNKWEQRTYGSAGFPLIGEVKKWTKQDFCMQACTATHYPRGGVRICVFYRTTEIIKKFGADLIFLRDVVLPRFDRIKSIHEITFMFSNITVHPMFFPTLLAHHPAPVSFLEAVRIEDERFHTGICKWMTKYLLEGETSWVQKFSQAKQTHKAMLRLMDKSTQRQLKSYFREHKK